MNKIIKNAARSSKWEIVDYFVEKYGVDFKLTKVLKYAIMDDDFERVKKYMNYATLENVDHAAKISAKINNLVVLKYLLGDSDQDSSWLSFATGRYVAKNYNKILESAILNDSNEIIEYMINKNISMNYDEIARVAVSKSNNKLVEKLCEQNKINNFNQLLLDAICVENHGFVKFLIKFGKITNYKRAFETSVHVGEYDVVELLLPLLDVKVLPKYVDILKNLVEEAHNDEIKKIYWGIQRIIEAKVNEK